jgi:hypothetical protein
MADVGSYRIRWANVQHSNGRRFSTERMCLAERRYWFGWWPVRDGDWRFEEQAALNDIERDKWLRKPLPTPKVVA